ncbi:MAG: cob(I)yrinic acid a,c-diamide adenosyltransferase [Sphingomonadaceae bacterium]|nr:cob(I)yrinic acid a,c-diamide adenosyltransferase [Sphingomonadaceae bacterium]
MVKLNRIYTRTGDDGTTGLVTGPRRPKSDLRLHAIGDVDEANSVIGIARTVAGPQLDPLLARIQNDLFDLGADLATPGEIEGALRIADSQVDWLEREIDAANAEIPPLISFVLPGGAPSAAWLHLARTVARRAERAMVALKAAEPVSGAALRYVNRVSDLLFVLARGEAISGGAEVLWVPGANR